MSTNIQNMTIEQSVLVALMTVSHSLEVVANDLTEEHFTLVVTRLSTRLLSSLLMLISHMTQYLSASIYKSEIFSMILVGKSI
ncbi:hypothetical protein BANRA_00528 [Acinetobacter baumannii]|nr:hypothetical protein BANRA_00528 [Acinetobacter baumannii]